MAAEKLYEQDSHLRECEARVTGCVPWNEGFAVTLDRTVLFPEGGGQPADHGTLETSSGPVPVTDVREKEGEVYHLTSRPLEPGETVTVRLDWDRRLDHIQQHTGEHILSHALWSLTGANNVGFHMGHDIVTIDLDRPLTQEELDRAEDYANRQIWEDRPIRAYQTTPGQRKQMKLRKTTEKLSGELRVVEVEGGDCCTCCGTHADRTGEVGLVKIIRTESHKGGTRVFFLCGRRALEDYRSKNRTVQGASAAFSAKEEGILPAILRMKEESAALGARAKELSARLMSYRAQELLGEIAEQNGKKALVAIQENCSPKEAKILLNELLKAPDLAVALVCSWEGKLCYLLGRSEGSTADCRFLCDLLGGLLAGKGGGKETFAQGSAKESPDWQETARMLLEHMLRG